MYYVGETYIGFDRNKCYFNTLEEALSEVANILNELIIDAPRVSALMREENNLQYEVERWIIQDTYTKKIIVTKTFILWANGSWRIQ